MLPPWLVSLALLTLAACARPEVGAVESARTDAAGGKPPASDTVETQQVARGTIEMSMVASGSIRARRVTAIVPEVRGRVTEVLADVGDSVEEGQPLARIDRAPYELLLAEARAGLALARAESENAAHEAERIRKLVAEKIASAQTFEQRHASAAMAQARVAQMEARVARARRELDCTVVRAPYAGSIVERRAHEGAMVGTEPILVLQETGALEAVLTIPEAWPVPVRAGDEILLYVEGSAEPLATRIHRVNQRVDSETRTYEVRAPVHDPSGTVKAGSYVRADVRLHSPATALVVDRSAVLIRDGQTHVFRVVGTTVERQPVRVGVTNAEQAQILSGLHHGDEVVRGEAVTRLENGAHITRAPEVATAGSAGAL